MHVIINEQNTKILFVAYPEEVRIYNLVEHLLAILYEKNRNLLSGKNIAYIK